MSKLGYTWYPKDWGNSESVFELNLEERGLYRELIDLAMLNDNTTEIKLDVWCRKFAIKYDDLLDIIRKLSLLNLIQIDGEKLFIPSCESRLKLVRGGSKGGKNSKPTMKPNSKPTPKPFESLDEKNDKPTPKQIEKKEKEKGNINEYFNSLLNGSEIETIAMNNKLTINQVKEAVDIFRPKSELTYENYPTFVRHFKNWLPLNKNLIKKDTKGSIEDNSW